MGEVWNRRKRRYWDTDGRDGPVTSTQHPYYRARPRLYRVSFPWDEPESPRRASTKPLESLDILRRLLLPNRGAWVGKLTKIVLNAEVRKIPRPGAELERVDMSQGGSTAALVLYLSALRHRQK